MKTFVGIVLGLVGVFIMSSLINQKTPQERAQETCEDDWQAYYMSQKFVKTRLASPASAKFPPAFDDEVITSYKGACKHTVAAYVDSQNAFGAMLRTRYIATLQYRRTTDDWTIQSLDFDE